MKILHCCLSCFYVDNFKYQENLLPRQNKLDGHIVKILASTEVFINSELGYINAGKYINEDGIEVIRVPYRKFLPVTIMKKIRFYKGVYSILESFKPDVIFFHGTAAGELLTFVKYMKKYKSTQFYVDSHEAFHNTAKTKISKFVYKYIHGFFLKSAMPYINKIFYIEQESKEYLKNMYHIKEDMLEWYPLGGVVFSDKDYSGKRKYVREKLDVKKDEILLLHSGKMDKYKKTRDILEAFSEVSNEKLRLVLIGSFPDNVWTEVKPYIERNDRILFLGWKSGDELLNYLCAADLYLQPGGCSATLQNAICCNCGIVIYPHIEYKKYHEFNNCLFVKTTEDIKKVLERIIEEPQIVYKLQLASQKVGQEIFDYKKLAMRIYE